uniref:Forkhead box O6 a n=1 Tax=Takifugu rubripes TaxID=31033 RepID=A0A674PGB5_TAKRU
MAADDELDAHQGDSDFEPQSRPRSCTWPLPPCPEDFPGGHEVILPLANIKVEPEDVPACRAGIVGAMHPCLAGAPLDVTGPLRKGKSSRRNAWGNQSYADLITRAIESSPEKRLTLSQIYDWMVRYVPYFKDKGDSNSSAELHRHNLSLHTRFIRVQNEGTGKSSWWMLNPDGGKMGQGPRPPCSVHGQQHQYLKSKGRIRGKRVGRPVLGQGSAVVGLQDSPDDNSSPRKGFPGSGGPSATDGEFETWSDLHSRTSSSASTLSGRLSPILLYPSPSSAQSPVMGAGKNCPPLEQLPQLANLTATISLDEHLREDRYHHHQPPQQQQQQHPSVGRQNRYAWHATWTSCHVATAPHPRYNHCHGPQLQGMTNGPYNHGQGVGNGTISSNYHSCHQSHLHERLPADLDIDMFHGSLDCDVESILLHDIMDSGETWTLTLIASWVSG